MIERHLQIGVAHIDPQRIVVVAQRLQLVQGGLYRVSFIAQRNAFLLLELITELRLRRKTGKVVGSAGIDIQVIQAQTDGRQTGAESHAQFFPGITGK